MRAEAEVGPQLRLDYRNQPLGQAWSGRRRVQASRCPLPLGRGEHWHKVKCRQRDRFVVIGFAPDGAGGLAKLRLARREGGKLVYAGRVSTGWRRANSTKSFQRASPAPRK
jgi:hypothetical protein